MGATTEILGPETSNTESRQPPSESLTNRTTIPRVLRPSPSEAEDNTEMGGPTAGDTRTADTLDRRETSTLIAETNEKTPAILLGPHSREQPELLGRTMRTTAEMDVMRATSQ